MKTMRKTHWLRNTILILAACAVIGLILSVILFRKDNNRTYVTSNLSFTFDGAQEGLAPNGYAFDINEISSEEVVTQALQSAGMDSRYTAEDIIPCIEVQGVFPEDLIQEMTKYNSVTDSSSSQNLTLTEYHPTVFSVSLYQDFDESISKADLTKLLTELLASYRSWFARTYAMGSIEGVESDSLKDYDYFQQLEILRVAQQQASDYAAQMAEKEPGFLLNGKGFNDVSLQFANMATSDLARLNATMTMNSLSKDLDRLKERYAFEIKELQSRVGIQTNLSKDLDDLLTTYAKSGVIYLSTSETLNKVDNQSSAVYDTLADVRREVTDGIGSLNKDITSYKNQLIEMGGEELLEGMKAETELEDSSSGSLDRDASADIENTADSASDDEDEEVSDEDTSNTENVPSEGSESASQDIDTASDDVTASEDAETTSENEAASANYTYKEPLSDEQRAAKEAVLQSSINRLLEKHNTAIGTLDEMIKALNAENINELTVHYSSVRLKMPSIISGGFIMTAIKTCGPICALGFMAAMVLIIISRVKEKKTII